MTTVVRASERDVGLLVASVAKLFREDGGRHEPYAVVDWPERHGLGRYSTLLDDPDWLLLVARDDDGGDEHVIGHLVGRVVDPSPTHSARHAVLESMQVDVDRRGQGVGGELVRSFIKWAHENGALYAQVSAYTANEAAQRFYAGHGFAPKTVTMRTAIA